MPKATIPKIAWCLIVKGTDDEAELLEQCLKNIHKYVDGLFIDINHLPDKKVSEKVVDVAKKYNANINITIWKGDFSGARNANFSRVPSEFDYIGWCDSDDTLDHPELIKPTIAALSQFQQGIYMKYDYDHDDMGNVTVSHWVARIVRNNGSYIWRSSMMDENISVHETLCEVIPRSKAMCDEIKVIHHSGEDRRLDSLIRNIKLLEGMYKKQAEKNEFDPRTLYYLATHYYDGQNFEDAFTLLKNYMQISGWAEERCEALVYMGNILRIWNKPDEAHRSYLAAMGEYQDSPRPYIELAKLDFSQKRYEESYKWIVKALACPPPSSTMVQRPMENSYGAYLLGAQACVNIGGKKLEVANNYIKEALKLRPLDDDGLNARKLIDQLINTRDNIKAAAKLIKQLEKDKQEDKILDFLNCLPYDTQDNPMMLNSRHKYTEPTTWGDKSIVIYVGQGPLGIWGPWSLESGIGGSEEAVIKLSRHLSDLGWEVTVYATPGDRTGRDGDYNVFWKQYYEFNPKDTYNVLIAWRNPGFFDAPVKAKKSYLWLHDVTEKEEFLPHRLERITKVIFVGKYHAELYKGVIPEDKWFISGNGISPEEFIDADGKYGRRKHRMIYMSAPNRGLKILLDNWHKVKEAVPDATLDFYYGWESYDAINSDNPERMKWKQGIVDQINSLEGVTDHGRIGHKDIIETIQSADIFAYPCIFPEVYCISYVKAMAGGAYPVSSNYAELLNYKDDGGVQVSYTEGQLAKFIDAYIKQLIKTLKVDITDEKRSKMMETARNKYSWLATAEQWDSEFLS
jgi:glycosyltransferase involved in cell wall biosynthesis